MIVIELKRFSFRIALFLGLMFPMPLSADDATIEKESALVVTQIVEPSQSDNSRRFLGVLAARDTVTLSFEVGGRLTMLEATEGAMIDEGQVLAVLDQGPFERALARAEITLEQAVRDLERKTALSNVNAVSKVAQEDATTLRDLAAVAVEDAKEALADTQIRAPFPSLVANRIAAPFTTVEVGEPIVRLHDISEMRIEVDIPERFIQSVDIENLSFEAFILGYSEPFAAKFEELRAEPSDIGQSYRVQLSVPRKAGYTFIPGSTVTVVASQTTDAVSPAVPLVPASAVIVNPDRSASVMVVSAEDEDLFVRSVPVEIISQNGTDLMVQGIAAGTEVVRVGGHLLTDGQPVIRYSGLIREEL